MKASTAGAFRIEIVKRGRPGIILLYEFDHHVAPLAVSRTMIERSIAASMQRSAQGNVFGHEVGPGPKLAGVITRRADDVGDKVSDLAHGVTVQAVAM
jgi:hypothetical protein